MDTRLRLRAVGSANGEATCKSKPEFSSQPAGVMRGGRKIPTAVGATSVMVKP